MTFSLIRLNKQIQEVSNYYKPYLSSTLRYERFMVDETSEQWKRLLGPDVCLFTHAETTANITKKFILYNAKKGQQITLDEKHSMFIAPLIHDWGEIVINGEGIGDITFDKKNSNHEAVELIIFKKVISIIKTKQEQQEILKIYLDIVMKRNHKLGFMFNAIERLGYLETAINAYKGLNGKRIKNWKGLVGNVLSNQIVNLVDFTHKYPYVNYFLLKNNNCISEMFEHFHSSYIPADNMKMPSYDITKLNNAHSNWNSFLNHTF